MMKCGLSLLTFFFSLNLAAQPYFPSAGKVYNDSIIPRMDILMSADSFDLMYTDLFTETEYTALFIFNDGTTVDSVEQVGIRVRGNTSQTSGKKSFKISFNTFNQGRKYYGLEKLHLNGEHNDPSIIRSKLFWDVYEGMKIPGARANHVDLYINGEFFGLYMNVEAMDENFVNSRFGNKSGNLYKCLWPANLQYVSDNPDDYKFVIADRRTYELQTNTLADDYSDLAAFIHLLEFTSDADFPAELEKKFNVNSFLRSYAVEVATAHWDDYAFNQNNFYLYHHPETDQFEFISYDPDNTFGIDWFGIDWGTQNIYEWVNENIELPLVERIMNVPEYVDRFTFFMKQLQEGEMNPGVIFPRIDSTLEMIQPSAEADAYRTLDYGWDYQDFLDSYTQEDGLGFHVTYGLKPYISSRHEATAAQLHNTNVSPIISNLKYLPSAVHPGDTIYFTAWVNDEAIPASVKLYYQVNSGAWLNMEMSDDGQHGDGLAGDEVFGASLIATNALDSIHFYLTARDVINQLSRLPRIDHRLMIVEPVPHLVINELMASNDAAVADEWGDFDDWLEIYNADSLPVTLANKYLSDEPGNPDKWRLPEVTLPPGQWALIWCDEEPYEGKTHATFKLSAGNELVTLYEGTGTKFNLLDSIAWENLATDVSIGCYPDGVPPVHELEAPTPGFSNLNVGVESAGGIAGISVYPNPFDEQLTIHFSKEFRGGKILLTDLTGKTLLTQFYSSGASNVLELNTEILGPLSPGFYVLSIREATAAPFLSTFKIVKN
jgi:hypothetical protein